MILYGVVGAVLGALFGFFVGRIFNKIGNACPILCNPKISSIYFGFLGFLIGIN